MLQDLIARWRKAGKETLDYANSSDPSPDESALAEGSGGALQSCADALERTLASSATQEGGEGLRDIAAERARQVAVEGRAPEHDDAYAEGHLVAAAVCYATAGYPWEAQATGGAPIGLRWPWHTRWFKPKDQRRNLVKAGALIAAEIDRLDRAARLSPPGGDTPGQRAEGYGPEPGCCPCGSAPVGPDGLCATCDDERRWANLAPTPEPHDD